MFFLICGYCMKLNRLSEHISVDYIDLEKSQGRGKVRWIKSGCIMATKAG